jgi:hypothetical protein
MVSSSNQIETIIRDAFEDVALLIGGVTTLHHLDDDVVRILIRRLDGVRSRALVRLSQAGDQAGSRLLSQCPCGLHPAIEWFLQRNMCGHPPAKETPGAD